MKVLQEMVAVVKGEVHVAHVLHKHGQVNGEAQKRPETNQTGQDEI
jgi:hypothetical protein